MNVSLDDKAQKYQGIDYNTPATEQLFAPQIMDCVQWLPMRRKNIEGVTPTYAAALRANGLL